MLGCTRNGWCCRPRVVSEVQFLLNVFFSLSYLSQSSGTLNTFEDIPQTMPSKNSHPKLHLYFTILSRGRSYNSNHSMSRWDNVSITSNILVKWRRWNFDHCIPKCSFNYVLTACYLSTVVISRVHYSAGQSLAV